jgi:hypothetical protein
MSITTCSKFVELRRLSKGMNTEKEQSQYNEMSQGIILRTQSTQTKRAKIQIKSGAEIPMIKTYKKRADNGPL